MGAIIILQIKLQASTSKWWITIFWGTKCSPWCKIWGQLKADQDKKEINQTHWGDVQQSSNGCTHYPPSSNRDWNWSKQANGMWTRASAQLGMSAMKEWLSSMEKLDLDHCQIGEASSSITTGCIFFSEIYSLWLLLALLFTYLCTKNLTLPLRKL